MPATATAAVVNWSASLSPDNEVPPTSSGSTGTGTGVGTVNDVTGLLTWEISWSGLTGSAIAMHFHGPAGPSQNASVVVNVGALSGLNSPSIGSSILDDVQIADLAAGLWYINIHTAQFPAGEIRGQVILTSVPEPATLALLGVAIAGLGFSRRHQFH